MNFFEMINHEKLCPIYRSPKERNSSGFSTLKYEPMKKYTNIAPYNTEIKLKSLNTSFNSHIQKIFDPGVTMTDSCRFGMSTSREVSADNATTLPQRGEC